MIDKLDRKLERQILELLRTHYPQGAIVVRELNITLEQAAATLLYLEEHGLCKSNVTIGHPAFFEVSESKITAAGLDFLEDDGGLSAILGIVTVKLHADTIRTLIEAKIEASSIPPEEKSTILKALAKLPATALNAGTIDLVKRGLDNLPDALHWLQSLLAQSL